MVFSKISVLSYRRPVGRRQPDTGPPLLAGDAGSAVDFRRVAAPQIVGDVVFLAAGVAALVLEVCGCGRVCVRCFWRREVVLLVTMMMVIVVVAVRGGAVGSVDGLHGALLAERAGLFGIRVDACRHGEDVVGGALRVGGAEGGSVGGFHGSLRLYLTLSDVAVTGEDFFGRHVSASSVQR